ncbi:hypothetical protein ACG94X_14050 [Acinetobacter sp. ULE_I010]|uniref:hypothetical protein n=1 Tax=Acinetobacter sp. ULE_I010 TaxID=3373065 RepID=UPI003AF9B38D
MAQLTEKQRIQGFIKDAKQGGATDQEIYQKIASSQKLPNFSAFSKEAKSGGATDIDIAARFGLNLQTQKSTFKPFDWKESQKEEMLKHAKNEGKTEAWQSALLGGSEVGAGVQQLFSKAADKIGQTSNKILGTNLDTKSYDRMTKQRKEIEEWHNLRREANDQGFDGWRLGGAIAGTAPLMLTGGGGALSFAGRGALSGGLIGGAGFAKDSDTRLKNTVAGTVGGAVGGVVGKKASDLIVRGVNAAKNNMRTGVKELVDEGEKHGVRSSVGDIGRNPILQKAEVLNEQVPFFGTAAFREGQQQEAKLAANKVVEKLQGKMSEANYKSLGKIQTAASNGDKNAQRILEIVNKTDGDSGKIMQAAAEIKNWRGHKLASNMFNRVEQQAGNAPVPATQMLKAIDDVIAADSKTIPNKELLAELNSIRSNWSHANNPQNYRELKTARSRLGELSRKWGQAGDSTTGLTQIRSAIDDDMANFALNSGNPKLIGEFKHANAFYRSLKEGQDKALANSMSSNTPDEIFKTFIQMGKGDKAANFYKNLDPKGQAALRYEMANRALDKATNESTGVFSPAKFAGEFEKMHAPYQGVFKGADKAEMDGFVKLMRHVERAGQYAENPPTGNRLAFGAISLASLPVAVKIAGQATLVKTLLTTATGRKILLAAKDLPPNSKGLENLLKMAQKLSTTTGSNLTKSNQ